MGRKGVPCFTDNPFADTAAGLLNEYGGKLFEDIIKGFEGHVQQGGVVQIGLKGAGKVIGVADFFGTLMSAALEKVMTKFNFTLEGAPPLVRTKDQTPGEARQMHVRVFTDDYKGGQYAHCIAAALTFAGLGGLDLRHPGGIKDAVVTWSIPAEQVFEIAGDPRDETDENGNTRDPVIIRGKPQAPGFIPAGLVKKTISVRAAVNPDSAEKSWERNLKAVQAALQFGAGFATSGIAWWHTAAGSLKLALRLAHYLGWLNGTVVEPVKDWRGEALTFHGLRWHTSGWWGRCMLPEHLLCEL